MEAYVDDVVIKTKQKDDLIADLEETFVSIRAFRIKLNPKPIELKLFIIRKPIYWMTNKDERNSLKNHIRMPTPACSFLFLPSPQPQDFYNITSTVEL